MSIQLPKDIVFIMKRLKSRGFRADIVGGSVRDFLLGKVPNDYDLTTDATPEEMRDAFSDVRTIDTGIKHGTLTVLIEKNQYEITTYRFDGEYSDNRHPDKVTFTRSLREDLARRDFTVNAMCYNDTEGFTDLFDGMGDLENRIIRAVGEPEKRFTEDALRIIRALRFAATLDFEIEEDTAKAIRKTAPLLSKVSSERIFTEWSKLISGVGAYRIIKEYKDIIETFMPELKVINLPREKEFRESDAQIRELSLFALNSGMRAKKDYLTAMTGLKSDNKRKNFGALVLENLSEKTDTDTALKLLLIKAGREVALEVLKLKIMLGYSHKNECNRLNELLGEGVCYRISDLKINGNDLAEMGIHGKEIGETLSKLLVLTAEGKVKNRKEELLAEVAKNR